KGLGKGLAALLGESETKEAVIEQNFTSEKVATHLLKPNRFQPRKNFDKKQLDELAQSIKIRGIIQPIVVRPSNDNTFEIIAGERRWRAAQLAQLHEIPVVKLDVDDTLAAEFAVLENIQREGLNALEEADGYELLMNKFSYTQDKLSEMIGKSRAHIANTLRLKKLPVEIQNMITQGILTPGHARTLIDVSGNVELAKTIANNNLSVRQAEFLAKKTHSSTTPNNQKIIKKVDPNIVELIENLQNKTGMVVTISDKKKKGGAITFQYDNLAQLEFLIKSIKHNY
ncbi:ParB/RepB/Spo0J family partition protein, partial [Pelagibacteraceae bacterium]|nr:ParB/RepB/Spo0J family partition protein [Pelagibacteraceae bacterium]